MNTNPPKKKSEGLTLVEVVIASAIMAIAIASCMVGVKTCKYNADNSMIKFLTVEYINGLLEAIQSLPYEEVPSPPSGYDAGNLNTYQVYFRNQHDLVFGAFDSSKSGVYTNDLKTKLSEPKLESKDLALNYNATTAGNTADNPFVWGPLRNNNYILLGPENNDCLGTAPCDPANGVYVITERQYLTNIFGPPKYYFMDDIDDFDGYEETKTIFKNVAVNIRVSVSAISSNQDAVDAQYVTRMATLAWVRIQQGGYAVMKPIEVNPGSLSNFLETGVNFNLIGYDQACAVAVQFYNKTIFKKVTITAQWEYPAGSKKMHSIVLDGGRPNPRYQGVI